eukprot:15271157-Alexandrium_andersonii.AAC.1
MSPESGGPEGAGPAGAPSGAVTPLSPSPWAVGAGGMSSGEGPPRQTSSSSAQAPYPHGGTAAG